MQKWSVKQDAPLWLVLHNGKEVSRRSTEAGAWANAWRRANTTAAKRGVKATVIDDEIHVAGGGTLPANWQANRRQRQRDAALKAGFDGIDSLVNAINDPEVKRVVLER